MDNEQLNHNWQIGHVSTAGIYMHGRSVYGCEDLSGNVWDWTRSLEGEYPYPRSGSEACRQREKLEGDASRVLRGGAFYDSQANVRSAVRNGYYPNDRYFNIGFRVCLSPFPLSDESLNDETLKR